MRFTVAAMFAAASMAVAGNAMSADMAELAKKHQCNACHAIDRKIVGPSWMDVSKAYGSNGVTGTGKKIPDILAGRTAEEWLLLKVSRGGAGNWGTMPMPTLDPDGVHQDDIRELIKLILGLSKEGAAMPVIPLADKPFVPVVNISTSLLALSRQYKCASCHALDQDGAGPSWIEISRAYNSDGVTRTGKNISDIVRFTTAENALLLKISLGGTGNWGSNPMPATDPDYKHEAGTRKMIKMILDLTAQR